MATATKMTATEFKAWASDIALCLCKQTKDIWTTEYPLDSEWNHCVNFVRNGKRRLWAKPDWNKNGMVTVFPTLDNAENPRNHSYNFDRVRKENPTSINCGMSKSPEKIAKDIITRILPAALLLADAATLDNETEAKRQDFAATETARLVEAIGNAGEYRDGKASGHSPYINLRIGEGYGEINPSFYSTGTASIEFKLRSLDVETAIAVCKLLQQFARQS